MRLTMRVPVRARGRASVCAGRERKLNGKSEHEDRERIETPCRGRPPTGAVAVERKLHRVPKVAQPPCGLAQQLGRIQPVHTHVRNGILADRRTLHRMMNVEEDGT